MYSLQGYCTVYKHKCIRFEQEGKLKSASLEVSPQTEEEKQGHVGEHIKKHLVFQLFWEFNFTQLCTFY